MGQLRRRNQANDKGDKSYQNVKINAVFKFIGIIVRSSVDISVDMIAAWGDGLLPVSFAVMAFAWMVMFGIPFGIIKHPTCYPVYHTG